jgi:D-arabinose 1-dehydrogenase-like Zn-dependent alcohol dehydrogenase
MEELNRIMNEAQNDQTPTTSGATLSHHEPGEIRRPTLMRALVADGHGGLSVETVPDPEVGPFDVLCKLLYGSVCAGTDTHVVHGRLGAQYPSIIGHESIGEVIAVGTEVRSFRPGDHVTRVSAQASSAGLALSWGGMCEFGIARDHRAMRLAGLPESEWARFVVNEVMPAGLMSAVHEPMMITWRETFDYVQRLGVAARDQVVVSGSGANGLSIAAMCVVLGADVTVVGSTSRAREVDLIGASGIDYRDESQVSDLVDANLRRVAVLIDATGQSGSVDALLPTLRPEGVLGVYGLDDARAYQIRPLRAQTFRVYNGGYREADAHDSVLALVRAGKLDASIWIDESAVFGWHDIRDAFQSAEQRTLLKPVVKLAA